MEEPIPPRYEDYELTAQEYRDAPKRFFAVERDGLWFRFAVTCGIGSVIYAAYDSFDWVFSSVGSFFFALFLGFFVFLLGVMVFGIFLGVPLFSVARYAELLLAPLRSSAFKNAHRFDVDFNKFEVAKKEYDLWRIMRQEEFWRSLDGLSFENAVGNLFTKMGYDVEGTPRTGDGGVNLILTKRSEKTVVQCKAHNKKIPIGTARELSAALRDFNADKAIIACFEGVTKPVIEYIQDKPIRVMDVEEFVRLQRVHG